MAHFTVHGLELEDLRKLALGKLQWKKCPCCDLNGQQYWDNSTGEGLSPGPSHIDPVNLDQQNCENCFGVGYILFEV